MADALSQRDIRMIFSAETSKATRNVGELSKETKTLRANLSELVEAAAKGDVSLDKLADTTRDLKAAQDELGTARSLVTQLNTQVAALEKMGAKTQAANQKFEEYKAKLDAAAKPTKRLTEDTERAGRAASKAAEDEQRMAQEVADLRAQIEGIVGPIDSFEKTFRSIAVASKEVARGLAISGEAADDFKAKLAALQTQQGKDAADKAFVTAGLDAGLLQEQINYISQFENRVELLAQAKRELTAQDAAFDKALTAQAAREGAQNVSLLKAQFEEAAAAEARLNQVNAFRKIAQDVRASVDDVGRFAPVANTAAATAERLADAILKIADPARAAGQSIDGIENAVTAASAVLGGKGTRSLQEYNDALNELYQANAALGKLANDVDTFKQQQANANAAAAAYDKVANEAREMAAAFNPAAENAEELAADLRKAEAAVETAGKEMQRTGEIAETMGAKLRKAGVDTTNLDNVTKRFTATAKQSRASIDAINGKTGRKGTGPLGFSLQDTQNLSYQVNDLITQIASGTPPLQAFAQQFGQIYQIPAIQNLITQFKAFLPLIALAVAAVGTFIAALSRAQDRVKGLKQINAAIAESVGGTKYDPKNIQDIIDRVEKLGVSAKEARGSVNALVRESVDPKYLEDIATAAINIQKSTDALGKDVPEVTKSLIDGLSQGKDGILQLDNQFHFLTKAQRDQIEASNDSTDAAKIQEIAFNALYDQAQETAGALSGDSVDASRALGNAWDDLLTVLGDLSPFEGILDALNKIKIGAAVMIRVLAGVIKEYGPAIVQLGQFAINPVGAAKDIVSGKTFNAFAGIKRTPGQIFDDARADTISDLQNDPTTRKRSSRGSPFRGVINRSNQPNPRKKGKSDAEREAERVAKQIESLQEQLTNSLDQMNAQVARTAMGSIQEQLDNAGKAVDSQFAKLYRDLDELDKLSKGRALINGMTVDQYRAQLDSNKQLLTQVAQLNVYENGVNDLLKQRNTILADIEAKAQSGQISATEAMTKATEVTSRLNPMIANLATAGANFANSLGNAKLSPEVERLMSFFGKTSGEADSSGPGSATGKLATGLIGQEESKLNSIIAQRNSLIAANNQLVELGLKTQADARTDAAAAYNATKPQLDAQILAIQAMIDKTYALGLMNDVVYDAWQAKLKAVQAESVYVDERITAMNNAVTGAFTAGFTDMFDTLAEGLAGLATGTKSVGEVLGDLGKAALQFAANFLKAMADVLVQMLAIQAVKAIFGAGTGGIGGFFFHSGTESVGSYGAGTRRRTGLHVPEAAVAAVPRYHNGTRGAGLKSNESLAVLERGEAVLTEEQQRKEAQAMAAAKAGGRGGRKLKQVLAFGDEQIAAAMAGEAGDEVVITKIRRHKTRIRAELGIS